MTGNVFEKNPPEMNVGHQFQIVKYIITISPPIVDLILNEKRISMIQSLVVVKSTMRINRFYKIKIILKYYTHIMFLFKQ